MMHREIICSALVFIHQDKLMYSCTLCLMREKSRLSLEMSKQQKYCKQIKHIDSTLTKKALQCLLGS